ncbi:hypothetical protein [Natribacillus halophilus]|nr:hypothetical protein [Natribacillus halophilus]
MIRDVLRLAWFEWKNMSVKGIGSVIFILVCYSILFAYAAQEGNDVAFFGMDIVFIIGVLLWFGGSQFNGEPFNLKKMNDGVLSSPFYRYMKRMPVSEVVLFRSRLLVKSIYLAVVMFVLVSLVVIVELSPFPFLFGNDAFVSFAAFWIAVAMISAMNAINEIGYNKKEDTRMDLKAIAWISGFLIFYLVFWVWLVPYNGTFIRFTIEYAAAQPTAMLAIAGAIVFVTLWTVDVAGRHKIKRQGV